jgi:hypothetical protein
MSTVSFDIGGVIGTNPRGFGLIMKSLRDRGHRVIVVTAIGEAPWIPIGDRARLGFQMGKLFGLGILLGTHYDQCYTTPDWGPTSTITGEAKGRHLLAESAVIHVDDNPHVLEGATNTGWQGRPLYYTGQSPVAVLKDIDQLL